MLLNAALAGTGQYFLEKNSNFHYASTFINFTMPWIIIRVALKALMIQNNIGPIQIVSFNFATFLLFSLNFAKFFFQNEAPESFEAKGLFNTFWYQNYKGVFFETKL